MAQFRDAVEPSTRLKKIFGNGLSLVCGTKHVLINKQGQISVNGSTPANFDFAAEKASGSFFPSTATYNEQRFKNEDGSASSQFDVSLFMPVTLGDSPLTIEVNNLTVTAATLGASCTAGS